jgi:transcriptional regulator with XRE-family HTH domain
MTTIFRVARRGAAGSEEEQQLREAFGARLNELRKAADLSHAALAKKAKLDRSVVTRLINGDNRANMDQILHLAGALDLSPVALLSDEAAYELAGVSPRMSANAREIGVILDQITDKRIRSRVALRIVALMPTLIADETAKSKKPGT